jgi:hypothetical protein
MSVADSMQVEAPVEPQKPKKAVSAYWLFLNEMREGVTKELSEKGQGKAKLGDIAKEVSRRWGAMPEADKKVYEDKATADKERYAKEFAAYLEASDPVGVLRKKYADMMPKKPLTAYFAFSQDAGIREKATEMLKAAGQAEPTLKQLTSKLAEMWKADGNEEKAVFEERYKKEKAEFFERQRAWQATPEFAEIERAEKAQEEKRMASEAADPEGGEAKGKKRGRSAPKQETPKPKERQAKQVGSEAKQVGSEAKRSKKAAGKTGCASTVELDAEILTEAAKLGLEGGLRNLAGRPEIVASGKKTRELLEALRASGGLVNPAKHAVLGQ